MIIAITIDRSKMASFASSSIPVNFVREQAYEGKYVIETEEPNLSTTEAVRVYKELSEDERAFANLKEIMEMRPIHHRTAERVEGHVFVASLALLIHRGIEKKLKSAGPDLSATEALAALKSLRVVDIALVPRRHQTSASPSQRSASRAYCGSLTPKPPTPPHRDKTVL